MLKKIAKYILLSLILLIVVVYIFTLYLQVTGLEVMSSNNVKVLEKIKVVFTKSNKEPVYVTKFFLRWFFANQRQIFSNFLLVLAAAGIIFLRTAGKPKRDKRGVTYSQNGTFGTARFMHDSEIGKVFEFVEASKAKGIILGKKLNKVIALPIKTFYNKHKCVFGASGSRKSRAYVRNAAFQHTKVGESMIFTDPKGELYRDLHKLLENEGYVVKVFNLVNHLHSDRWNPLEEAKDDIAAQTFAEIIIANTEDDPRKSGDKFWDRAEKNLLKALALYVNIEYKNKKDRNIGRLYRDLLANDDPQLVEEAFSRLPNGHPAKMPFNIYMRAPEQTRGGVITGLGNRLQLFQNEIIYRMTEESDIDLLLPAKQKCAYFCIVSDTNSTFDFLSSLFFSYLFIKQINYADSRPNGKCDVEVNFELDEFPNIGQIPDFPKKISTMRSRGLNCAVIFQNIPQFQNRYPNGAWQEIIGNCDTKLGLGYNDDESAEFMSKFLGETTILTDSYDRHSTIVGTFETGESRRSEQKRRLVTLDEVLRLPPDDAYLVLRGQFPLQVKKFDFSEHPMAKNIEQLSSTVHEYVPAWSKDLIEKYEDENGEVKLDVLVQTYVDTHEEPDSNKTSPHYKPPNSKKEEQSSNNKKTKRNTGTSVKSKPTKTLPKDENDKSIEELQPIKSNESTIEIQTEVLEDDNKSKLQKVNSEDIFA